MRNVTTLLFALVLLGASSAYAQETDFVLEVPLDASADYQGPYTVGEAGSGTHSGARAVTGPFDLDGDGQQELLLTDYTGGGRVHVIENRGTDTWELVYTTPWMDSTATTSNARYAYGANLDDDGQGEILFISGHDFSETNPDIDERPLGLYIFEYTGTDDDYGDAPAAILEFESSDSQAPPSVTSEQFAVVDIDQDGNQEILVPGNSSNDFDIFYIYSFTGDDVGGAFAAFNQELAVNPRDNSSALGGGSPYAAHPADLDGDGTWEISFHSWNNFNFFNADVTDTDTYEFGDTTGANMPYLQAASEDHVSLFGGTVVDMNGDGDDEVYYPAFQTGDVSLLNYEDGEDILVVTEDNLVLGLIEGLTSLGLTSGDLTGDGVPDLIGSGASYTASAYMNGELPTYVRIATYNGGDVEDPASYEVQDLTFFEPFDTSAVNFDFVQRDSLGTDSTYYVSTDTRGEIDTTYFAQPGQGPVFVSKLAFLGDPDGDSFNEVALAFQGVDDSTYVLNETWDEEEQAFVRTVAEARPNENRAFLRVISSQNIGVKIVDERVVLPSDYQLSQNYPNPFNPKTTFSFELPLDKQVSVKVYDVLGRVVKTLVDNERYPARVKHEVTWDGTNDAGVQVASGMYVYTLEWGNFRKSRTMVLVK